MQNYLLELTMKLCLDHQTLVCFLAPEFPGEKLIQEYESSTKQNKHDQKTVRDFDSNQKSHNSEMLPAHWVKEQENVK